MRPWKIGDVRVPPVVVNERVASVERYPARRVVILSVFLRQQYEPPSGVEQLSPPLFPCSHTRAVFPAKRRPIPLGIVVSKAISPDDTMILQDAGPKPACCSGQLA
jgi:hypothetical protein